ncbi:hypothetical protein ACGYK5_17175 [Sulfitobacter sp. 1A16787]|uniref:hypothetical protein n=1 Tax=Sulfitobacter sp. 1A16787 TaxID=3368571 RepID=UPI003747234B
MATDFERLNIVLAARDREFARAMDRNTKRVERFAKRSNKNLSSTTRAMSLLSKGAAALVPVLAAAFSYRTVQMATNFAREVANAANIAGVGAEEIQRLAAATNTVGISQEKLSDIYKDVNERVGEFLETGAGPMKDFFEYIAPAVGVTADQFARLSGPEALQLYVDSLEKAGVSQQEMTFYLETMASDTSALIPLLRDGGAEMKRLGDEAQDAGRVLSDDTVEGLADLQIELDAVKETLRNQFIQAVADSSDEILALADFVEQYGIPALQGLVSFAGQAAEAFNLGATAISEFIRLAGVAAGMPQPGEDTPGGGAQYSPEDYGPGGADPDGDTTGPGQTGYIDADGNWVDYGTPEAETPVPGINSPVPPAPPVRTRAPGSGSKKKKRASGGGGSGKGAAERAMREEIRKNLEALVDFDAVLERLDATTQSARDVSSDYTDTLERAKAAYDAGEISAREYSKTVDLIEEEFRGVIEAAEEMEQTTEDMFASIVTGAKSGREAVSDLLATFAQMAAKNAFSGVFDGMFDSVAGWFGGGSGGVKSYDGGGYTGDGPRSGGLDGKGGRLAMIHPQETVVDHTRGQRTGGGGGTVVVHQTNHFTSDVKQGVRAEMNSYAPRLIEATRTAVADKARRSPSYRRNF